MQKLLLILLFISSCVTAQIFNKDTVCVSKWQFEECEMSKDICEGKIQLIYVKVLTCECITRTKKQYKDCVKSIFETE